MSAMFIFISLFLGLLLLILAYFFFKSESAVRAKLRYVCLFTLVAFCGVMIIALWPRYPQKDKPRLSVLPLIDYDHSDDSSWIAYHLSDEANSQLERMLASHFRIFPPKWLWQCLDGDSVRDRAYLQNFSRRIGLDYAVIGSISFVDSETVIDYFVWQWPQGKQLHKGRVAMPLAPSFNLGGKLAQEVVRLLLPEAIVNPPPSYFRDAAIAPKTLAAKHLACRNYERAVAYAAQAYAIDSCDVKIRNLYAEALLMEGRRQRHLGREHQQWLSQSRRLCEETLSQYQPEDIEACHILAKYYLTEKMYAKAEALLLKVLALHPEYADAFVDYAYLHPSRYAKIKFKNEEQLLQRALALNPCHEEARVRLADFYYYRNQAARCRREIQALLAIHPRSIDGLMYLGKLALEEENFAQFSQIYDRLLQIDSHNPEIFYNLGIYYYHLQDWDRAEQFFNRAVQLGDHLDSHLYLGYIYEKKGLLARAVNEYGWRVRGQRGAEDEFAEEARKRLRVLTKPDSIIFHANDN